MLPLICFFFFFNDTATTEIYTLSLHDALPIYGSVLPRRARVCAGRVDRAAAGGNRRRLRDRKSTRLNSSHGYISYAVFCLKKKKKIVYERYYYSRYLQCIPLHCKRSTRSKCAH